MAANTIASTKQNLQRADFDNPWKHSLQFYFRDFLEFCLPHIAKQIDWSKDYESLDKDLNKITRDAEIGNRIGDKLIKVWKKDGKETLVLCHIEVDGNPKKNLPKRMMIYRYRIYDLRRLPIISIAVLIDDDPNWRVNSYREECFGTYQEIHYIVIKLLDYQKRRHELEAMNNRFAVIMLAQLTVLETRNSPNARLNAKTGLTRLLYKKNYSRQDIIQLYNLIDWLITLPETLTLEYNQAIMQFEEEQRMNYISTAERIGIQKGFQQGLEQGLERGVQKGEATVLMHLLERRFSHIPPNYFERIQQANTQTLLIWAERVLDATDDTTIEEIFN